VEPQDPATKFHSPPVCLELHKRPVVIMVTALSLAAGAAFVGSRAYAQSTAKVPALAQVINQKSFNVLKDPPTPLGYNASSVSRLTGTSELFRRDKAR